MTKLCISQISLMTSSMGWRWQDWRQGDRLREHLLENFNRKMMAKQGSTMTRSHEEILRASMGREDCSELWKESSLGVNLRCFFFFLF